MCLCLLFGFLALGTAIRPENPLPRGPILWAILIGSLTDLALLALLVCLVRSFFVA